MFGNQVIVSGNIGVGLDLTRYTFQYRKILKKRGLYGEIKDRGDGS